MASLTLALIVVCVVSLAADSTRWLGVLALALLVVVRPVLFAAMLVIAAGAYLYFQRRRDD